MTIAATDQDQLAVMTPLVEDHDAAALRSIKSVSLLKIGTPVWVKRKGCEAFTEQGTVAYLGPVKFAAGDDWVGVQLKGESAKHGKNSGTVQGTSYFETQIPNSGIFVRKDHVSLRTPSRSRAMPPLDFPICPVSTPPRPKILCSPNIFCQSPNNASQHQHHEPVIIDKEKKRLEDLVQVKRNLLKNRHGEKIKQNKEVIRNKKQGRRPKVEGSTPRANPRKRRTLVGLEVSFSTVGDDGNEEASHHDHHPTPLPPDHVDIYADDEEIEVEFDDRTGSSTIKTMDKEAEKVPGAAVSPFFDTGLNGVHESQRYLSNENRVFPEVSPSPDTQHSVPPGKGRRHAYASHKSKEQDEVRARLQALDEYKKLKKERQSKRSVISNGSSPRSVMQEIALTRMTISVNDSSRAVTITSCPIPISPSSCRNAAERRMRDASGQAEIQENTPQLIPSLVLSTKPLNNSKAPKRSNVMKDSADIVGSREPHTLEQNPDSWSNPINGEILIIRDTAPESVSKLVLHRTEEFDDDDDSDDDSQSRNSGDGLAVLQSDLANAEQLYKANIRKDSDDNLKGGGIGRGMGRRITAKSCFGNLVFSIAAFLIAFVLLSWTQQLRVEHEREFDHGEQRKDSTVFAGDDSGREDQDQARQQQEEKSEPCPLSPVEDFAEAGSISKHDENPAALAAAERVTKPRKNRLVFGKITGAFRSFSSRPDIPNRATRQPRVHPVVSRPDKCAVALSPTRQGGRVLSSVSCQDSMRSFPSQDAPDLLVQSKQ